tara:strand:+ start:616 stop:1155 length:540 start_codon:yes stop_codon:yes gene_type:complete
MEDIEVIKKRKHLRNTLFVSGEPVSVIGREFLEQFSRYKSLIQDNPNVNLWVIDTGNDYRTDYEFALESDDGKFLRVDYFFDEDQLREKISELYPETEAEKLSREYWEAEILKKNTTFNTDRLLKVTDRTQDKFRFGKYKGEHIFSVYKKDKNYIAWCIDNVEGFGSYLTRIRMKNRYK